MSRKLKTAMRNRRRQPKRDNFRRLIFFQFKIVRTWNNLFGNSGYSANSFTLENKKIESSWLFFFFFFAKWYGIFNFCLSVPTFLFYIPRLHIFRVACTLNLNRVGWEVRLVANGWQVSGVCLRRVFEEDQYFSPYF